MSEQYQISQGSANRDADDMQGHSNVMTGAASMHSVNNNPMSHEDHHDIDHHLANFSAADMSALLGDVSSEEALQISSDALSDSKAAARSERKRSREKQRRQDVNAKFQQLLDGWEWFVDPCNPLRVRDEEGRENSLLILD